MAADGDGFARMGPGEPVARVGHMLGLAVLVFSEWFRFRLAAVRDGDRLPTSDEKTVLTTAASLADQGWHRAATDLYETVSFGQERAALWAAVFFALVVRLNKTGPQELQVALSYVSAAYCVLAAASGAYYFVPWWLVLVFGWSCYGIMSVATRK